MASSPVERKSFRRARASKACEICHSRKIRCDVTVRMPCTNCVAFNCDCKIPENKGQVGKRRSKNGSHLDPDESSSSESEENGDNEVGSRYVQLLDDPAHSNKVAFLGSSLTLGNLLSDEKKKSQPGQAPLPESLLKNRTRINPLQEKDLKVLELQGAFLLPPKDLCDELINCYFEHWHPLLPLIDRTQFMRQYQDPKDPPSLLLLQAILLVGSRVCDNPALLDSNGSADQASILFFERAKALYDASYEADPISIVQAVCLLGWWWENLGDVTKNVYYWTHLAITVAQGFGLHRSVDRSSMSPSTKRLWKRVWWCLFMRDRTISLALGRPTAISVNDMDVAMVTEQDFIESDDTDPTLPPSYDRVVVLYFIHMVKLSEIMGLVLRQQYSGADERGRNRSMDIAHCDMALGSWMHNLPEELRYSMNSSKESEESRDKNSDRRHLLKALLHSHYYTTLCLLHREHFMRTHKRSSKGADNYPSRNIAFQAANMIAGITANLIERNQIRYMPSFFIYTLFSAMVMFAYQLGSSIVSVLENAIVQMRTCRKALAIMSRFWTASGVVSLVFDAISMQNGLDLCGNLDGAIDDRELLEELVTAVLEHRRQERGNDRPQQQQQQQYQRRESSVGNSQGGRRQSYLEAPQRDEGDQRQSPCKRLKTDNAPSSLSPSNSLGESDYDQYSSMDKRPKQRVRILGKTVGGDDSQSQQSSPASGSDKSGFAPPPVQQPKSQLPRPQQQQEQQQQQPEQQLQDLHSGEQQVMPFEGYNWQFAANSPLVSQSFFENFKPLQLFPEGQTGLMSPSIAGSGTAITPTVPRSVTAVNNNNTPVNINNRSVPGPMDPPNELYHFTPNNVNWVNSSNGGALNQPLSQGMNHSTSGVEVRPQHHHTADREGQHQLHISNRGNSGHNNNEGTDIYNSFPSDDIFTDLGYTNGIQLDTVKNGLEGVKVPPGLDIGDWYHYMLTARAGDRSS